ncbi:hypothetical protein ACFPN1_10540 [Lysobacter yangpyeongensis]|uniref:Uncharacterized protein n=1 Tax=Lysobacter yangpyeongensis TaxID=346182 RepID=A0ABW0SN48_9GAMM
MNAFFRACLLACILATPAAWGAEPKAGAEAPVREAVALTGHYYLEGIMETGSELLLAADGRFQWYFTYGALDLAARGTWKREGERIVLLPDDFRFPPQYPETRFERMQLRIDGDELIPAWPWEEGAERGRYVRD